MYKEEHRNYIKVNKKKILIGVQQRWAGKTIRYLVNLDTGKVDEVKEI